MDCSPTGSSDQWDFPGKNTGVGCHFFLQGIFPTQGLNLCLLRLLHCRWILCHWAIRGSPRTEYLHKLFGTLHRKLSMFVSIWSSELTHYYVFCTMTYNPIPYYLFIAQTVPALAIGSFQLAPISLWNKSITWVCVCVLECWTFPYFLAQ